MNVVEIVDRRGWKYARIVQPRGQGRALLHSLGTKSEEEARRKVADACLPQIQLAAHADALTRDVWTRLIAGRRVTVADSIAAFREHRAITGMPENSIVLEQRCLDAFMRFSGVEAFAKQQIAGVEPQHIAAFVNAPDDRKLSSRSRQLTWLNCWLNFCVAQRWLVVSPALEVRVRFDQLTQAQLISVPHAPFTEGEIKTLLSVIPRADFWHGAVLLAYHFGLRLGAIATLEETNILAHDLRVYTTKGARVVHERLPDDLIAWFAEWRAVRPVSEMTYLFPAQAAAYLADPAILSKQFRSLMDANGFRKDAVFHGLKKTAREKRWSSEMDELGDRDKRALMELVLKRGLRTVQKMLAHADGSDVTEKHYFPAPTAPLPG